RTSAAARRLSSRRGRLSAARGWWLSSAGRSSARQLSALRATLSLTLPRGSGRRSAMEIALQTSAASDPSEAAFFNWRREDRHALPPPAAAPRSRGVQTDALVHRPTRPSNFTPRVLAHTLR